MRKSLIFIALSALLILFVFFYLKNDSDSFYYGYDCKFCSKYLPYNLKPQFYFEYPQKFVLLDEDEFELVNSGFRYETCNFKIKDFLAYGYNDNIVIIKCTDSINNIKYLISYETGDKSKNGNPEISFKDLSEESFKKVKEKLEWFEVSNVDMFKIIKVYKFFFTIGVVLSMLFVVVKLVKLKKNG
jgi:hypothetical protein